MISSSSKATARRAPRAAAWLAGALGALMLVAACGGGSSQYEPFAPKRLLVFGDDASALTASGHRYGVNGFNTDGAFDCSVNPLWVQSVASLYGFVFAECNPTSEQPTAIMRALPGATVDDVAAEVEAQVAAGGFRDRDMATVLAGFNDVYALYAEYPSRDEASLVAEAGARGKRLAQVVNRLVDLGAKVIVSDLPDLGLTPYAIAQDALGTGAGASALLTRLSTAFNEQLGVNLLLDGRYIGLVQAQLRFQALVRSPASFGITDWTNAICTAELPDCTTSTLTPDAAATSSLWADDKRLAPGGQTQLAGLAVDRAQRNPF